MKFLIVVTFVAIVAAVHPGVLNDEQKAKAEQYIAVCKEQQKVTDDEIAKLKAGDFTDATDYVKCFANCFLEQASVVKDGELQDATVIEKFGSIVGEDKAKQVLDTCRSETGANKCETSFKLLACFQLNKTIFV